MEIIYASNYEDMSRKAAIAIVQQVIKKPTSVLGFATGSTPLRTYEILREFHRQGIVDFSSIHTFNLDEYVGLSSDHPQSYAYFMFKNLFHQIQLDPSRIHIPMGTAIDLLQECANYEEAIQNLGGIDFQLLGLGSNGHIGFNEPGTHFNSVTQVVSLSQETIEANSRFFTNSDEVPKKAISMGIKSIMNTRKILLLVSGEKKAEIIKCVLTGPISEEVPASVLQLHPNTTVVIDQSIL